MRNEYSKGRQSEQTTTGIEARGRQEENSEFVLLIHLFKKAFLLDQAGPEQEVLLVQPSECQGLQVCTTMPTFEFAFTGSDD